MAEHKIKTESHSYFDEIDSESWVEVKDTKRIRLENGTPVHVDLLDRQYLIHANTKEASDRMLATIKETETKLERIRSQI